jgi:hypothetical protein
MRARARLALATRSGWRRLEVRVKGRAATIKARAGHLRGERE